jgi:hypothetical protein
LHTLLLHAAAAAQKQKNEKKNAPVRDVRVPLDQRRDDAP